MYLLRWCYHFPSSVKYGIWSHPGKNVVDQAWYNYKDNLVTACIERKHLITREIDVPFSCSGQDFIMFQWIATASLNPFSVKQDVTPLTRLAGIKMVTRTQIFECYTSGEKITKPHNGEYNNYNFAIYGK